MKRFIVIVLDGFGIGAMADVKRTRPGDESSNTLRSILKDFPVAKFPNLEKLGLMNAYGFESENMKFSDEAVYGKSELMHFGADTFMGHQEIMGTKPMKPLVQPFQDKIEIVQKHLLECGHKINILKRDNLAYLLVDDYCTVGDNIDADLGIAYNCTAPLDFISFNKVFEIGKRVRQVVEVGRVIVFGGNETTLQDLLNAEETRKGLFIGVHAVKSKSYNKGYQCIHLGYGVNETVQAPTILAKAGIPVSLFGKVADIVINEGGKSVSCVNTNKVFNITIEEIKKMNYGFICTNIQETDLAGHSQNTRWYKELLELSDEKIGQIVKLINPQDILIVMADHGNDPNIGHNMHTRENVPLLIKTADYKGVNIGLRKTLSDVGASVCEFFHLENTQNGKSFLNLIKKSLK